MNQQLIADLPPKELKTHFGIDLWKQPCVVCGAHYSFPVGTIVLLYHDDGTAVPEFRSLTCNRVPAFINMDRLKLFIPKTNKEKALWAKLKLTGKL